MIHLPSLVKQLRHQEKFLLWMGRRYLLVNPEQSEAFKTGAELFKQLRLELTAGEYDIEEELLTIAAGYVVDPAGDVELHVEVTAGDVRAEQERFAWLLEHNKSTSDYVLKHWNDDDDLRAVTHDD